MRRWEPIAGSRWIWYPGENGASSAPAATRYFKCDFEVKAEKIVQSANLWVVADNDYTVLVNGRKVGEGNAGGSAKAEAIPIQSCLVRGKNRIAVSVTNSGASPNPAGLLGALEVIYQDGTKSIINTNGEWRAGQEPLPNWELASTDLNEWKAAEDIGEYAMAPWNRQDPRKNPPYPTYAATSDLLKSMGVSEDFASQGAVRYTHRQTDDQEIYFVANRSGNLLSADCNFRVGKGVPELWDPLTGEQRALPQYTQQNGVTTVPIKFDKNQSFFVIFNKAVGDQPARSKELVNFPESKEIQEITGPWEVAFDPKRGGPEKVSFEKLVDWTLSEVPGIKYYSGIATYRKTFDYQPIAGKRICIDLGVVNNVARVRLNGKDLGAVWCAPWRAELTGALKPGQNQLEVEVANLWKNRLIGDQLSENRDVRELHWPDGLMNGKTVKAGRYTYTQNSPYNNANSPLSPSGLMGPVKLVETP
jgi:hypothetical protein